MKTSLLSMIAFLGLAVAGQQVLACGVAPLNSGLSSVTSCDGRSTLNMQSDGNLVLYSDGQAVWSTGTTLYGFHTENGQLMGTVVRYAVMQSDGNLVIYGDKAQCSIGWGGCGPSVQNQPIWNSGTGGQDGSNLVVQDDGNMVIYNSNGNAVWSTNTSTR